jgi:hypothetical protein
MATEKSTRAGCCIFLLTELEVSPLSGIVNDSVQWLLGPLHDPSSNKPTQAFRRFLMFLVRRPAQAICTLQVKSISSLTKTRGPLPLIDSLNFELDSLLLVDDPEACEPGREIGKTRMGLVDLSPGICDRRAS